MSAQTTKSVKGTKRDKFKHSYTGAEARRGAPRKKGAGAHGWGVAGDELKATTQPLDKGDPNYDSLEEEDVLLVPVDPAEFVEPQAQQRFATSFDAMQAFKRAVKAAVVEFLSSYDRQEFIRCIDELGLSLYHQEIPKIAITAALDKSDTQRLKIATLLNHLHQRDVITAAQMEHGFQHLFNRVEDLRLDCPTADALLKEFVGHALAAEILSEAVGQQLLTGLQAMKDADSVDRARNQAKALAAEYFDSQDLAEAKLTIEEQKAPHFHHEIVKRLVYLALDRNDRERELASYLLASFAGGELDSSEIEKAFEQLLQRVEDLYHDVPQIFHHLSCFLARAVADEVLPPAFLPRAHVLPSDMGRQVIDQAQVLLSKPHAIPRLAQVWGPGDGRSVPHLKKAVRALVQEYFTSGDIVEAKRCVRELNAPYFLHEVVKRIVVLAADKGSEEQDKALMLLQSLAQESLVSQGQLSMGLDRVNAALPDLVLDAPNSPAFVQRVRDALSLSA